MLGFVDGDMYETERSASAVPAERLGEAIDHWLALDEREEGTLETEAGPARYVALPLSENGREALFVAANFPALERDEIDDAVRTQAVVQFAMIVLASLLGLALAGRVMRPLRSLAETAQTISATDLTRRIPVRGEDEASSIARAFNEMLERIERSFATQRQFLDDASHELRSPMTVIRGHVELLELETDPAEREVMVKVITDEIERMNRIVEDLLLLARSERPGFLTMEPVDVAELVDDVHRRASVLCQRNWQVGQRPKAVLTADRQLVTQAMLQLAQNVCQHTPEGATARIGASVEDRQVSLWVEDDGPGVPPAQAATGLRALRQGLGSVGRQRARAVDRRRHRRRPRGPARLAARPGPGARFEIVLPLRPAAVGVRPDQKRRAERQLTSPSTAATPRTARWPARARTRRTVSSGRRSRRAQRRLPVDRVAACRDDDHRNRRSSHRRPPEHVQTVHVGQAEIEQLHVDAAGRELVEGRLACRDDLDTVALRPQTLRRASPRSGGRPRRRGSSATAARSEYRRPAQDGRPTAPP